MASLTRTTESAFGLSLAVSWYQDRRANVVSEANAIGTAYVRAQTLAEPVRSGSLDLLVRYTRAAIELSEHVPGSAAARAAAARETAIERRLWRLAAPALDRFARAHVRMRLTVCLDGPNRETNWRRVSAR